MNQLLFRGELGPRKILQSFTGEQEAAWRKLGGGSSLDSYLVGIRAKIDLTIIQYTLID